MHGSVLFLLAARCRPLYALLGFTKKDPLAELSLVFYSIGFMSRMNIDDNLNNKRQRWLSKVVPVFYDDNIDNWGVFIRLPRKVSCSRQLKVVKSCPCCRQKKQRRAGAHNVSLYMVIQPTRKKSLQKPLLFAYCCISSKTILAAIVFLL